MATFNNIEGYEVEDTYARNKCTEIETGISIAEYIDYELGTVYSGQEGIMKHSIVPTVSGLGNENIPNGFITHDRTSPFPKVKGTKGRLITSSGLSINVPELFTLNGVSDECTENAIIQRFSDEVTLKYDWLYEYNIDIGGMANGVRMTYHIPLSELQGKPQTVSADSVANLLQPAFRLKKESALKTAQYWGHFISWSYDGTSDYATMIIISHRGGGASALKKALEVSQFTFRYPLAEPKVKYNVDKIYIKNGDTVNFELEDGYNNYSSISLQTPSNISASVQGIEPITANINDLNYRVENVEVSADGKRIGVGDGVTDDTAAIQAAINDTKNLNPEYAKEVVLQAGVYRISSPLRMNVPDMTLRGQGEVILWATEGNYEPIIRVMEGGCKIENIKIYLAKTADDINYALKGNGISRGYLKSYKESMDTEDKRYGNGHYCGIYIDVGGQFGDGQGLYGFYNVTIKDVIIQGAYRYSTKFIEKSYGIYFSKGGFCYFNQIQNCHFNSVMCGMYMAGGCAPSDVTCTFDIGDNIYNISGAGGNAETFQRRRCDDVIGCRWGIICDADSSTIHVNGQCVGEDSMNPYIYDEDGYEFTLDESTATVTGKQAYVHNGDNTYSAIEGETTVGFADNLDIQQKRLTEAGVLVRNGYNTIDGMIYDSQRSEFGCIYLTDKARHNKYEIRTGSNAGYGKTTNAYSRYMYMPVEKDANGNYTKWTQFNFISVNVNYMDCGRGNVDVSTNTTKQEPIFGSSAISAVDKYGVALSYPRGIDKVDDVAAYVDKIGSVKCYYTENDGTETPITEYWVGNPSKGVTTSYISSLFRPNNDLEYGIYTGLTFKQIPTDDNPIIMEIDFGRDIKGISIGCIRFNRYIARTIDIGFYNTVTHIWDYYNMVRNNFHGEFMWNTWNDNGTHKAVDKIRKMRIKFGSAYQPTFVKDVSLNNNGVERYTYSAGDTYNPEGYVGIGKIFIGDYNGGGSAYLTRSGGRVYGDIEPESVILKSTDSSKRFKISVNDSGVISAVEV